MKDKDRPTASGRKSRRNGSSVPTVSISRRRSGSESSNDGQDASSPLSSPMSRLSVSAPVFTPQTTDAASSPRSNKSLDAGKKKKKDTDKKSKRKSGSRSMANVTIRPNISSDPPEVKKPISSTSSKDKEPREQERKKVGSKKTGSSSTSKSLDTRSSGPRQRIGAKGFSRTSTLTKSTSTKRPAPKKADKAKSIFDSDDEESEDESDDEVYPEGTTRKKTASAFPERLTLFSQQKRIPNKRVSRENVVDTIFSTLFAKPDKATSRRPTLSVFGDDDTGTDTDEPNEELVKQGLTQALFRDHISNLSLDAETASTRQEMVEKAITPALIHTLVTEMRFEDFRTASPRLDLLRAIHRNCPTKRLAISQALSDAANLRLDFVQAMQSKAQALEIERPKAIVKHTSDHGHGFTELLRYAIEHMGESALGLEEGTSDREEAEMARNYMRVLTSLWKAHWRDTAGTDDEELIDCAGQFVAYLPHVSGPLIRRLLTAWPHRYPSQQVVAIRMLARVIMSGPPLNQVEGYEELLGKIFRKLSRCVQSLHVDVAQEALAFTGSQFVMVHFISTSERVYSLLSSAFHAAALNHWNASVRESADANFDRALDYSI